MPEKEVTGRYGQAEPTYSYELIKEGLCPTAKKGKK